jgi:heme-degrading monooxygenase HmoA
MVSNAVPLGVQARVDVGAGLADTRSPLYARLRGGGTMHARVAFYRLRSGSFEQVVRTVEAPGGLLEIFRGRPGFQSYELIETGAGLVSVSHWESSAQADAATHAAAAWVADHIDDLVKLQQSDTGEVVLSSLAAAATR